MQTARNKGVRSTFIRTPITVKEAAKILGIPESTLRGRKAGTEKLTRIKYGRKSVRLIRQEVEAHLAKLIRDGQAQSPHV
jgi:excisionase family DNA binding protein